MMSEKKQQAFGGETGQPQAVHPQHNITVLNEARKRVTKIRAMQRVGGRKAVCLKKPKTKFIKCKSNPKCGKKMNKSPTRKVTCAKPEKEGKSIMKCTKPAQKSARTKKGC